MHYSGHLAKDKKLKRILEGRDPFVLKQKKKIYLHLCSSIMSQQLSVKVAETLWKRFLALYDKQPTPAQIAATPLETLRGIGLSNAKSGYIINIAKFAIEQGMDWKRLQKMTDEEVIQHLVQIKGVGRWTAEMTLMFALGREDIFAIDDWGVQNAMINIYKLDNTNKKEFREKLLQISKKWSPFRTYACLHLWRWKDAR